MKILTRLRRHREPVPVLTPTPIPTGALLAEFAASWQRSLDQMGDALRPAFKRMVEGMREVALALDPMIRANDPVRVAGLEGRFFVRAGLDPGYRDPRARDGMVYAVLCGAITDCRYLTPENRGLVAAAILTGWETRGEPVEPTVLAWHRKIGDTRISVGRAS